MKNLVVLGVDTKGIRTTKIIKTAKPSDVTSNPRKYNLSKVSAVISENYYNQTMETN